MNHTATDTHPAQVTGEHMQTGEGTTSPLPSSSTSSAALPSPHLLDPLSAVFLQLPSFAAFRAAALAADAPPIPPTRLPGVLQVDSVDGIPSSSQRFMHVADWSEMQATPASAAPSSSSSDPRLLGVHDFTLPSSLLDLLDMEVGPGGTLQRLQPQSVFGRLVPMPGAHHLPTAAQATAAARGRSLSSASTPPPPTHSHLHQGPDPAALQQHIQVRRLKENMQEMDEELELLSERAAALSAEYQSDSRALAEYQERMARRQQALMASQLDRAQQQWLQQERQARQARNTLQQIDEIMAEKENSPRSAPAVVASTAAAVAATASTPAAPSSPIASAVPRLDVSVQYSPRPADDHTRLPFAPTTSAQSSSAQPSAAASRTPSSAARIHPVSKPGLPSSRFVKKRKPKAKLEAELDSALSQAQHLLNDFMDKLDD